MSGCRTSNSVFRVPDMTEVSTCRMMAWLLQSRPGVDAAKNILSVSNTDRESFGRAYVATELAVRAWVASIRGIRKRRAP